MWCIGKLRICLCFTSPIHCHPLSSFPSTVFCVFGCILYLGIVPDTEFPRKRRVNCHCSILPIFFKFVCLASPIFGLVIATPWLQLLRARNSSYHTGYYVPYSFRTMFGFSKIQQNLFAQGCETGPTVYRPYPFADAFFTKAALSSVRQVCHSIVCAFSMPKRSNVTHMAYHLITWLTRKRMTT